MFAFVIVNLMGSFPVEDLIYIYIFCPACVAVLRFERMLTQLVKVVVIKDSKRVIQLPHNNIFGEPALKNGPRHGTKIGLC